MPRLRPSHVFRVVGHEHTLSNNACKSCLYQQSRIVAHFNKLLPNGEVNPVSKQDMFIPLLVGITKIMNRIIDLVWTPICSSSVSLILIHFSPQSLPGQVIRNWTGRKGSSASWTIGGPRCRSTYALQILTAKLTTTMS
jgi:hypothetical protein